MSVDEVVMKPVEAPPRNGRSTRPWDEIRQGLISQPNQWIHVFTDVPQTVVRHLKSGEVAGFAPADYEWVSRDNKRTNGVRRCDVYGRYVGTQREGN